MWLTELFFIIGAATLFTSAVGLVRFPDFFARLHAVGLSDSIALPFVFIGYAISVFPSFLVMKLFFCLVMLWVVAPLSCYLLVRSSL